MLRYLIAVAALSGLVFVVACGGLDSSLTDFEVGDCIQDPNAGFVGDEVESLDHVDCSEPGTLRVIRVFQITQYDDYPGDAAIDSLVDSRCPFDTTVSLFPTRESWNEADDREVVCFE